MVYPRIRILEPRNIWWERLGVFNPAVIEHNKKIYMIYRAYGADHISRFGLAISNDGEHFQVFDDPIVDTRVDDQYERLGIEDPRIVFLDKTYFITYTAASVYPLPYQGKSALSLNTPGVPWRIRSAVMKTKDFQRFERLYYLFPTIDTKNSVLFPKKINNKYFILHRISPNIYLDSSSRLHDFGGGIQIAGPRVAWEEEKIGAACPPIETNDGWLLLYHGVSKLSVYSVGAMLLDLYNPYRVLRRSEQPFLTPKESWEKTGYVKNVVFPTGGLKKGEYVNIYYGAADKYIGLVKVPIEDITKTLV